MTKRAQELQALIRSPEYGKLVVAQTVSTVGNGASALTLTVLVTRWLGLAGMSEYLLATTIPGLVLGAAAGVLTDRRSRRTLVAVIEIPNGLAFGLLQACLPAVIALNTPNELLGRTNAALGTTTQAGFLLSLPVAGALAHGIGVRLTFGIAAGAVIAATILIYGRTVTRRGQHKTVIATHDPIRRHV